MPQIPQIAKTQATSCLASSSMHLDAPPPNRFNGGYAVIFICNVSSWMHPVKGAPRPKLNNSFLYLPEHGIQDSRLRPKTETISRRRRPRCPQTDSPSSAPRPFRPHSLSFFFQPSDGAPHPARPGRAIAWLGASPTQAGRQFFRRS